MNITKHRDGRVSITLDKEEQGRLWGLVREGRRQHFKQYGNYNSEFAFALMRSLNTVYVDIVDHIGRFGNELSDKIRDQTGERQ